jgi:hypothetical protein
MRIVRRMMVALTAALLLPAASFGQVMSQVPANAFVVVHVKDLTDLSQKIAAVSAQIGLPPPGATPASDALTYVTKHLGLTQGVNATGDFAFAMLDTGDMNGPTPPIVLIIPVTDYKTALSNFPNAVTDGAVSTVQLPDGATAYMANWGSYLAVSPMKDVMSATPGGLTMTATAAKEMDAHDVCALVNMPQVRTRVLPLFVASRQMALTQISIALMQQPAMAKFAGPLKAFLGQGLDVVQNFLSQCDDVTVGLNLSPDGISLTSVCDFNATSHYGQMIAAIANSDKPLMTGIPDGKYLAFGGAVTDAKADTQMISEILDPVVPELQKVGPDGQPYLDYIEGIKELAAAQTGASFAWLPPDGELGTSPMFQFIGVRTGDAKALAAAAAKLMQTQADQAKAGAAAAGGPMAMPVQLSYTAAAKTVDGVALDQFHTGLNMGGAMNPQLAKIGQYLGLIYGQDGLNIYSGAVNDTTYLQMGGLSDDKITAAVAAAKTGDDALSKLPGVVNTAAKLPTQRVGVVYIALDNVVNTVFTYMGKFGLDMGVTMPAVDPIGLASSNEGSAVRLDIYIPGQILTSGAQVAGKLMVHRAVPVAPGGAAPAPGGGM